MAGGGGTPGSSGSISLNIIPLIDVICVLIMFFILSTQFASQMFAKMQLAEPKSSLAKKAVDVPNRTVVNVVCEINPSQTVADPLLSLKARCIKIDGNEMPLEQIETLKDLFQRKVAECKAKGITEPYVVEVRADKRVSYSYVEPIMVQASMAGITNMTITAMETK